MSRSSFKSPGKNVTNAKNQPEKEKGALSISGAGTNELSMKKEMSSAAPRGLSIDKKASVSPAM